MDKTPLDFYLRTIGKSFDVDGWPEGNRFQCWDYFAEQARSNNVPLTVLHCSTTTYVQDIWDLRYQSGILNYYDPIPTGQFRNGDFVIWPFSYALTPKSHVAMYWNGEAVGQSQSGHHYVCAVNYLDFNEAVGGFRLKTWEGGMKIGSGRTYRDTYAGQDIIIRGYTDGHQITMASAKTNGKVTGTDLQPIRDIDDDRHVFYSKLNCNFWDMSTGQALGVRCGIDEWSVPRQGKFLYYAVKTDGSTEVGMDTDFWYGPNDVVFACSPALIMMHNGEDVDLVSPETEWKREWSGTQSLLLRTTERFCVALVKGNLSADQCRAWAKSIDGIQDLCILDSGGSAQLQDGYDVYYATGEHRPLSNVIAEVVEKAVSEPSEAIPKEDEHALIPPTETAPQPQIEPVHEDPAVPPFEVGHESEDTAVNEQKTVKGQLAKLIDVKSIMTVMVISCLCYLVVTGQPIDEKFMQIVVAIMTFYFGYQANKKEG